MTTWLNDLIQQLSKLFPEGHYLSLPGNVSGLLAVILVSLICGAVGSLVVANRMAFFSDALAHCAFAGVALGLLLGVLSGAADPEAIDLYVTLVMVAFGIAVGLGIAVVRESTFQSSDTVIGVFFAGAIGLGAVFLKAGAARRYYPPEDFLFGNLVTVSALDLIVLFVLLLVTVGVLAWLYNDLVFASFNQNLALSRRIRVRLCNYVFIVLLAVIVNVCLKAVGALLINALLIVPAATAALFSRNMRQLFWFSVLMCVLSGVGGHALSWELTIPVPGAPEPVSPGQSGTIVVLSVLLFFGVLLGRWVARRVWKYRPPAIAPVAVRGDGLAFSTPAAENSPPE